MFLIPFMTEPKTVMNGSQSFAVWSEMKLRWDGLMRLDLGKPTSEMNGEKGQVDMLPLKNNKIIIFTAVTELPTISLKFPM